MAWAYLWISTWKCGSDEKTLTCTGIIAEAPTPEAKQTIPHGAASGTSVTAIHGELWNRQQHRLSFSYLLLFYL